MSKCTRNDVTGDSIKSRKPSRLYEDNYDKIFGSKNLTEAEKIFKEYLNFLDSENWLAVDNCHVRLKSLGYYVEIGETSERYLKKIKTKNIYKAGY